MRWLNTLKKILKPLSPTTWSNIREGMLLRIVYILTTILGTLFVVWFLFFFLTGENVLLFFDKIEEKKAKLQLLILISGLPLFLLLWGFRTEDTNTKLYLEAVDLLGSKEARRQALIKLLFLKNDKKVFIEKINRIIEGADFSSKKEDPLNLSNMDLRDLNFKLVDFSGSNLARSNLDGSNLEDTNLEGANLELTSLKKANLEHSKLKRADLTGANLTGASLAWANLQEARLINVELQKANLKEADLKGVTLKDADLTDASLESANLKEANLTNANLENTILTKAYYNEHTKGLTQEQKKEMNHV